jgi:hypothetical protein
MNDSRSIFWPLVLVAVGGLWLLANFGVIERANLGALLRIWPVFLIGLGVDLLLRPRWPAVGGLVALATVAIAVAAVVWAPRLGWASTSGWWSWMPMAWGGERGSGQVITETREVSGFQAVVFGSFGDLTIRQGEAESLTIEGEDNVLRGLTTEVRAGTLYLGTRDALAWVNVIPTRPVRYTMTVRDLSSLTLSGAGNVDLDGLEADRLELTLSGAGRMSLRRLQAETLAARLSGAGSLQASGSATRLEITLSGAGSFAGADLQAETAQVVLSGTGSATVWATSELDARISGLGSVKYYGRPRVTENISGLGSIQDLGDK